MRTSSQITKRVPRDFPWKLLDSIATSVAHHLPISLLLRLDRVIRSRSVEGLSELESLYGLQSMNRRTLLPELSPFQAAAQQMVVRFLSKAYLPGSKSPSDRRRDALLLMEETDGNLPTTVGSCALYDDIRSDLQDLLGDVPDMFELNKRARHGPGSSYDISFKDRSLYFKYADWPYTCTPKAFPYLRSCIMGDARWFGSLEKDYRTRNGIPAWAILNWETFWSSVICQVPGNRVTTVPKSSQKDRCIAIEPTGNVYLQLAVHEAICHRIKRRWGYDLKYRWKTNRRWSQENWGNSPLSKVTIDLSNASDTVSLAVAEKLLPRDWFELLCSLRSPVGELPDRSLLYRKLSSMGNGTTFAIETILFEGIARACCRRYGLNTRNVAVFGDDIIVPRVIVGHVLETLLCLGFQPNTEKSFLDGPIRESCGVDSYKGVDIRPVFFREDGPSTAMDFIALRNRIFCWYCTHLGCEIPRSVDALFIRVLGSGCPYGPPNLQYSDAWLFSLDQNLWKSKKVGGIRSLRGFTRRAESSSRRLKQFRWAKLMSDLRSTEATFAETGICVEHVRYLEIDPVMDLRPCILDVGDQKQYFAYKMA